MCQSDASLAWVSPRWPPYIFFCAPTAASYCGLLRASISSLFASVRPVLIKQKCSWVLALQVRETLKRGLSDDSIEKSTFSKRRVANRSTRTPTDRVSEENKMACSARYNLYGVGVKNNFRFLILFLDGFHRLFRQSGSFGGPLQVCQGASAQFENFLYNYYFGAKTSSSLAGNELGRWFFRTSGRASTSHIAPLWLRLACCLPWLMLRRRSTNAIH